jgi:ATP-dependent helicase/nuclease subunit A
MTSDILMIEAALERARQAQQAAADPAASAWVSANAGTGKTHVLTMRTLRLMLAGTAPERILCLTYTKAAAAEMAKRVFGELAAWVTLPESELIKALERLTGRRPTGEELILARALFATAIETPGGLKYSGFPSKRV